MISKTFLEIFNGIWPMVTIFLVVIIVIRLYYMKNNRSEFCFHREFFNLLFIVYALLLYELVTNTEISGPGINLIPFTEITRYSLSSKSFFQVVLGNIFIFIPFGYFVSAYVKAKGVKPILVITLVTSLTIELVQLKIGRAFDIDDIILNILGGLFGFFAYISLYAIKKHLPAFFQRDFIYNLIALAVVIVMALYFLKQFGYWWF